MSLQGKEHEQPEELRHAMTSDMLLSIVGLLGIGAVVFAMWLFGPDDGLPHCESISSDRARLACYDRLAIPHPPPKGAFPPAQIELRERTQ